MSTNMVPEPCCRYCHRPISERDAALQEGLCGRCWSGEPVALGDVLDRLPADAAAKLSAITGRSLP